MSAHPAPPSGTKKPSALASCILLGIILGALGALGGGGFWAYKTFIAKPSSGNETAVTGGPSALPNPMAPATPVPTTPANPPRLPPAIPDAPQLIAQTEVPPPPIPNPVEDTPPAAAVPAPAAETPPAAPAAADPDPMVKQEPIQSFPENAPEVASLKADADRRIDEAPTTDYSDGDKTKVREAIRVAKRLTRVATLQFGAASARLGNNERNRFKAALQTQEMENLLLDPQAVFFTIGYADASGTSEINRQISQKRAAGVESVLKSFKVTHKCYSVGIGTTTLISAEKQSKNRAVEVWVVLP